ncbi:hypothetical protein D9V37_09645 [Nocardioides mangrovicus]|uniref:Uncharacterized protein n=1 Tax=Nocardioides mangrovicus TaxID=2478913 RepID=A0A3L8P092_9ACTN|nr:hypothetical protein [Nocardioides mangrovicus]RLV48860.1 hypothetical protein D9V37_09645 [Nocardioides mangrovicus]
MASYHGVDTPALQTRTLIGGALIGLVVGIGLAFLAAVLGVAFIVGHPQLSASQRNVVFLAPFAGGMVLALVTLVVPVVRRLGGGVLVGVMVGAAATVAVVGGVLAGTAAQSL